LPEEQWAQLTFRYEVKATDDPKEPTITQFNVFERRLADKISYMDWKLSYVIDMEDFNFIHAKPSEPVKKAIETSSDNVQRDIKQE